MINVLFQDVLSDGGFKMDRVAIWGCGNYTAKVINRDSIPWDAIYVFCDSDVQKQGTFFMGHRVVSPLDIDQNCKKIAIGADIFYPEIFNQALEMYPDKEIVSIDDFEKNFERKKIGAINWNGAALNCQLNESESIKKRCLEGAQLLSDVNGK